MTEGEAVAAARALIGRSAREGRHHVAATVLTSDGRAHSALNLECVLGRGAICAESVAIGLAMTEDPAAEIVFSVAVNRRGLVIPPCGLCRELLLDYGPRARVAVPGNGDGDHRIADLASLIPSAYKEGRRGAATEGT